MLRELEEVHRACGMPSHERILACHLISWPFSDEPQLITPWHRLCRDRFKQFFAAQLPRLEVEAAIVALREQVASGSIAASAAAPLRVELGSKLLGWQGGDRHSNVEEALTHLETALLHSRDPADCATIHRLLGEALCERQGGRWSENQEAALAHFAAALDGPMPARGRAMTHASAGRAHLNFPAEHSVEEAIRHLSDALTGCDASSDADVHQSLGQAYMDRSEGRRTENLASALQHFKAALEGRSRDRDPRLWAQAHSSLGAAYLALVGDDMIACSLRHLHDALEVLNRDADPLNWALVHAGIGRGLLLQRKHRDAAPHLQAALEVLSKEKAPAAFAAASLHLSLALWATAATKDAHGLTPALAAANAALVALEALTEVARAVDADPPHLRSQMMAAAAVAAGILLQMDHGLDHKVEAVELLDGVRTRSLATDPSPPRDLETAGSARNRKAYAAWATARADLGRVWWRFQQAQRQPLVDGQALRQLWMQSQVLLRQLRDAAAVAMHPHVPPPVRPLMFAEMQQMPATVSVTWFMRDGLVAGVLAVRPDDSGPRVMLYSGAEQLAILAALDQFLRHEGDEISAEALSDALRLRRVCDELLPSLDGRTLALVPHGGLWPVPLEWLPIPPSKGSSSSSSLAELCSGQVIVTPSLALLATPSLEREAAAAAAVPAAFGEQDEAVMASPPSVALLREAEAGPARLLVAWASLAAPFELHVAEVPSTCDLQGLPLRGSLLCVLPAGDAEQPTRLCAALSATGASAVLCSRWPVPAAVVLLFLGRVHRQMRASGQPVGEAVASAQQWLQDLRQPEAHAKLGGLVSILNLPSGQSLFQSPRFWASFAVVVAAGARSKATTKK